MISFPVRYDEILQRINQLDTERYSKTRNYYDGAVSYLSPYLSRGVITLPRVLERVLRKNSFPDAERFIYELAWREYFQRVWDRDGWNILTDVLHPQQPVAHHKHVARVVEATTGIEAIDEQVNLLYNSGYMHNHARMYVASITCNIARAHWNIPAKWMYYHLLDGDLASNALSWQWIAGTFSAKKYYCNQSSINQFSGTSQTGTLLDKAYEDLQSAITIPDSLSESVLPSLPLTLPGSREGVYNYSLPLLLYTTYNLDPQWRSGEEANRVLLLEPSHFQKFPVSVRVLDFIIQLSQNIPGIQIITCEVSDIPELHKFPAIYSRVHPAFRHYPGDKDPQEWMFPKAVLKSSFSAYWKSCQQTF